MAHNELYTLKFPGISISTGKFIFPDKSYETHRLPGFVNNLMSDALKS